jgi:anthranilate synthase/aminodeoxychorismate synthase-like glutamine amidotransferase
MILLIDNYDSFTWNLFQMLSAHDEVRVIRNDQASLSELVAEKPSRLMISPGPGAPDSAGVSIEALRHFAGRIPVLGVCLGHQALGQAFGGRVVRAGRLMHGKTSPIRHDSRTVFSRMPQPFAATRYHSLLVERDSLPKEFEVSAWTEDENEIMGLRHLPTGAEGVQFHPESILTQEGAVLLRNFATC